MKNKGIIILLIINLVLTVFGGSYLVISSLNNKNDNTCPNNTRNTFDIVGKVTNIQKISNGIIMLVEDDEGISIYDKAFITVTNKTFIVKTIYSRMFTPDEIHIGDKVKVIFDGPVAESYPVQAKAKSVWIIESEVQ